MRMKRQDFAQSGLYGINHSISFFTLRLEHSPLVATKSSCLLSSISYTKMQAHTNTGSGTQDDLSSQADNCFNNYMIFFITMMNQHSLDISAMCIGHLGALLQRPLKLSSSPFLLDCDFLEMRTDPCVCFLQSWKRVCTYYLVLKWQIH